MELPEETKIFLLESYEGLDRAEQELLALEKDPSNEELINRVFRTIHTIKGNCGFLGLNSLEAVCHKGEALLDRLRSKKLTLNTDLNTLLLEFVDYVRATLNGIESSGNDAASDPASLINKLMQYNT